MSLLDRIFGKKDAKAPYPRSGARRTLLLGGAGDDADRVRAAREHVVVADVRRGPGVTLLADLCHPFPFREASFDEIFSLEFVEHIPHPDLPRVLAEARRVLAPGGTWISGCPDMEALVALFPFRCDCVKKMKADPGCATCGGKGRITSKRWVQSVCGFQEDYGDARWADTHKNVLWFERLKGLLEEAGFREVRRGDAKAYYEEGKDAIKLVVEAKV